MLFSTAAPLASLFFFSSFAVAGIYAPDCSTTWRWSFNSLGQNACTVAAYMMSTCNGGSFTITALDPGEVYTGPSGPDNSNLCKCSTIGYSLISACDGCQGVTKWMTWSEYIFNCTKTMPPGSFPNAIPMGTRLPQWALLDVANENYWNANKSYAVGDTPELAPGTIPGPSGSSGSSSTWPTNAYPSTPASSSSSSPYTTSSNSRGSSSNSVTPIPIRGHSSNKGAIAGGVTGGIAAISIVIAALLLYLRRRRPAAPSAPSAPSASDGQPGGFNPLMDQAPRLMSGQGTVASSLPETTTSMLRLYNADDPATYSTYQGISPPPTYNPNLSPSSSTSRNLYTVAAAPDSQGLGLGYNGRPIV